MDPAAHYGVRGTGTPGGGGARLSTGRVRAIRVGHPEFNENTRQPAGGDGDAKAEEGEDLTTVHRKLGSFGIRLSR